MLKNCYIFGAAEGFPESFKKESGDLIIAADGGFRYLESKGIIPDIILGDFDSLGSVPEGKEIIKHPVKKDDTDTLLAVKVGLERGYSRFFLYGCTGKRLDHTIANLQTLSFISKRGGLGFLCGDGFTAAAITNGSLKFKGDSVGTVSVFSAGDKACGINIKGLLYPLENAELDFDFPLGVSNEFIGKEAEITVKDGTVIVIWQGTADSIL